MGVLEDLLRGRRRPRPPRPQTIISRQIGKGIAALIIAGGAALFGLKSKNNDKTTKDVVPQAQQIESINQTDENYAILNLIAQKKPSVFIEAKNVKVIKLMRNDNRGARHQRFIVQFNNGVSLRAIYNLDLSEKVPVSVGDLVSLGGELEYDDRTKEPLLHWLHSDPQKKRPDGYVLLNGKKYGEVINQ